MTTAPDIDTIVVSYKEGAAKLADHLRQQAALKTELQRSASEAEATGFQDFAELFQELATKLGSSSTANGKESTASARRRGRPPKPADDQPATA